MKAGSLCVVGDFVPAPGWEWVGSYFGISVYWYTGRRIPISPGHVRVRVFPFTTPDRILFTIEEAKE